MDEQIGIHIGRRLKALREAAQLTQAELARLSLKSVETISNFERGKTIPSVLTLEIMAKNLGAQIGDFFDDCEINLSSTPEDLAILNKSRILPDDDKALVIGFIDLLNARSRDS